MKLKELKAKLNALPDELEECDVNFTAEDLDGVFIVDKVISSKWEGEVPEGCTEKFVLLS